MIVQPGGTVTPGGSGSSVSTTWDPPPEQWRDRTRLWQVLTVAFALLSTFLSFLLLRPEGVVTHDASAADMACEVLDGMGDREPSDPGARVLLTLHQLRAVEHLAKAAFHEGTAAQDLWAALDQPSQLARQGKLAGPEFHDALAGALDACQGVRAQE